MPLLAFTLFWVILTGLSLLVNPTMPKTWEDAPETLTGWRRLLWWVWNC
jgi:hypothetical protein